MSEKLVLDGKDVNENLVGFFKKLGKGSVSVGLAVAAKDLAHKVVPEVESIEKWFSDCVSSDMSVDYLETSTVHDVKNSYIEYCRHYKMCAAQMTELFSYLKERGFVKVRLKNGSRLGYKKMRVWRMGPPLPELASGSLPEEEYMY